MSAYAGDADEPELGADTSARHTGETLNWHRLWIDLRRRVRTGKGAGNRRDYLLDLMDSMEENGAR